MAEELFLCLIVAAAWRSSYLIRGAARNQNGKVTWNQPMMFGVGAAMRHVRFSPVTAKKLLGHKFLLVSRGGNASLLPCFSSKRHPSFGETRKVRTDCSYEQIYE